MSTKLDTCRDSYNCSVYDLKSKHDEKEKPFIKIMIDQAAA